MWKGTMQMKLVSFPLYTLSKYGPDSVIDGMSYGVFFNFLLFFLVLFLVYYLVRRATNSGQNQLLSKHIRIVEKMPLGMDRYILIMALKDLYYIVYMDKNGATLIDKRDDLDIEIGENNPDFQKIFSKWVSKKDREQDESDDI